MSGLSFDELRQVGAGRVFGLGEKGRRVLLHQSGQRGLFRAVGTVMSLYGRATGRAFVATLPSHKIDAVLAGPLGLHGAPPTSTRQRQREDKTIETEFRSHGLLRVVGTPLPGINAFSAPVFDHEGQVALVITLLGAQESFAPDWDAPAAQALRAAAKEVSERLGVKLNSN